MNGILAPDMNDSLGDTSVLHEVQRSSTPSLHDAPPPIPGYEVYEALGRGGMGVVYRARQIALNRIVALKTLRSAEEASQDDRARFRIEAAAVAALAHPGIVQIYEVGDFHGLPYLALEYVPGGTLASRLDGKPQPPRLGAYLVAQLAAAMQCAHERGIVHRDLKPGNVLMASPLTATLEPEPSSLFASRRVLGPKTPRTRTQFGDAWTAKVTDFGIAKQLDAASPTTRTYAILGTPTYMSPEQADQSRKVRPAADIYSLGAMLYELLTGRPPFVGSSAIDTLLQVRMTEPVPPTRLNPGVPRDLEVVCMKCLRKDPARRYPSAAELAADLQRWLNGEPIHARPAGVPERAWRWCRRHPVATTLIAAAACGVVGLAAAVVQLDRTGRVARAAQADAEAANAALATELKRSDAERLRAEANLKAARQAVEQTVMVVGNNADLQSRGLFDLKAELLQTAIPLLEQFAAQSPRGDINDLDDRGWTLFRLGYLRSMLRQPGPALESYAAAQAVYEQLARQKPDVAAFRQRLAMCHGNRALLLEAAGRFDEAMLAHDTAAGLRAALALERPGEPGRLAELATGLVNRGRLLQTMGRSADAEKTYREAVARAEPLLATAADAALAQAAGTAWANLAGIYDRDSRPAEAAEAARRAREVARAALRKEPRDLTVRLEAARAAVVNGTVLAKGKRLPEAEAALREGRGEYDAVLRDAPGQPAAVAGLATALYHLSGVLAGLGNKADARDAARAGAAAGERVLREAPGLVTPAFRLDHAETLLLLAGQLPPAEALPQFAAVGGALEGVVSPDLVPRQAAAKRKLAEGRAEALIALRRPAEALPDLDAVVQAADPADRPAWQAHRALALAKAGQPAAAVTAADAAFADANLRRPALVALTAAYCVSAKSLDAAAQGRALRRAVECVERMERTGGLASPEVVDNLERDADCAAIHHRPDYLAVLRKVRGR